MEQQVTNRKKGIILAIIAATMWGIMGIFVRGLSSFGYSNYDISFVRCALAGMTYLTYLAIKNPKMLKIDLKGLLICIVYGAIAYSLSFTSYSIAVSRIPVAVATVLMFMSPIWVVVLGALVFKEKIKLQKIMAISTCLIGAALVANLIGISNIKLDIIGIVAGVVNGFGVALQIMIPRYFEDKYEKDTMLVYGFLGAALVLLFKTDINLITTSIAVPSNLINLIGLGILGTMVANVAYVKSTNYVNTSTTSILSALEVIVGAIVGLLIYNEALTVIQLVGALIIVIGAIWAEKGEK